MIPHVPTGDDENDNAPIDDLGLTELERTAGIPGAIHDHSIPEGVEEAGVGVGGGGREGGDDLS